MMAHQMAEWMDTKSVVAMVASTACSQVDLTAATMAGSMADQMAASMDLSTVVMMADLTVN